MNAHAVQINEDEIDLRELFKTLIRHKKKIIFFTLLFGIVSAGVAYFMPNVYSASSTVEIGADDRGISSQQDILAMAMAPGALTPDTEIEIIKSRFVVANALLKVDFAHRYYQTSKMKETELYKASPFEVELERGFNLSFELFPVDKTHYRLQAKGVDEQTLEEWEIDKVYDFGQKVDEAHFAFTLSLKEGIEGLEEGFYRFEVLDPREAMEEAQEKVTVSQKGKNSAILQISAEDNVPLRAKEFVNVLAEAYIDQSVQRKTLEATMTLEFIDEQLALINTNLQHSAVKLENYKKEINMVDLGTKAQGVVEKMSEYEGKLAEVAMEEKMLASLYAQVQRGRSLEMLSGAGL
ncbi:MAG: Capsular biosynthesis protein, partial [Campylobacterota bacterium]|nr:Capsular biosynthesis protein [Campylobacterota bacterium]